MSDNEKFSNIKKPNVKFCSSCVYPSSSAATLEFNDDGVCSGCLVSNEKGDIDWEDRKKELASLLEKYKSRDGSNYDCIIPVSGGKDSYYQTHVVAKELGYNPLLVTYNANNYTETGIKNLHNMREVFGVDHIFFTPAVEVLKSLNRIGVITMGDMNWHAHSGIFTYPIRAAVDMNIPLMIWGEHGRQYVAGMFSYDDFIEFTYRDRFEHACRSFEWDDILKIAKEQGENIEKRNLIPWMYPSDEEINRVGVRGIFIANYVEWDENKHTELMKKEYGFLDTGEDFERTYRTMSNLDDMHENGMHDYLRWVKFGYGRASDHVSKDIRNNHISRKVGIEETLKRDHVKSKDLKRWLDYVGWSEKKFDEVADTFRDPRVWWIKNGKWTKRNIDGKEVSYGKVFLPEKEWYKYYIEEK